MPFSHPVIKIHDLADEANILVILGLVSGYVRGSGVPEQFITEMHTAAQSAETYAKALSAITSRTGISFVFHGKQLNLGGGVQ